MYKHDFIQRTRAFKNALEQRNINPEVVSYEYDADDVWAASWAAYRINGYEYIREPSLDKNKVMNRVLVYELLNNQEQILDEDRHLGREMREYNTRLTMVALTRNLNSYEQLVAEVVLKDKIKGNSGVSIVASVCNNFHRELKYRKKESEFRKLENGGHVGSIGDRDRFENIEIISSKISRTYLRYFNLGNYNGNLVSWWNDTGYLEGSKVDITARVKEHSTWAPIGDSVGANIPVTKLNYVSTK